MLSSVKKGGIRALQLKTSIGYAFVHFSVEAVCFYIIFNIFKGSNYWWALSCLYDILAFGLQPMVGALSEKYDKFNPGLTGGVLLVMGAVLAVFVKASAILLFTALVLVTVGNALVHISGAMATLRVSEGRLSESAVFVGGGSFGLISGRLLGIYTNLWIIPVLLMIISIVVMVMLDGKIKVFFGPNTYDFIKAPCKHDIAGNRNGGIIIFILFLVVTVRAYIGYGLPTAWNKTVVQTILLFVFMGTGKMLGGILSDIWGARRIGVISCLIAVPALLMSNNIMWLSLIGVALFSMTMAITLGGIVSVMKEHPGVAFGVTTLGLLLGTVPTFFANMPSRLVCDVLIFVLSVFAAAGLWYCITNKRINR